MLKIKDNVDLKELEKFGFKKFKNELYHISSNIYDNIVIDIDSKEINLSCIANEKIEDIIFDLIQLGLVEKV